MVVEGGSAGRPRSPEARRASRWVYGAAVAAVLLLAAGLRFHGLGEDALWYDEAVVALNSQGTLAEVLGRTRAYNTAPILVPAALWAVQKVAATEFSVRLLSTAASLAAVAVLLLGLPRVGLGRWSALFAGVLAAMSVPAIVEARDAREYSVDALVAALLIVGLLRFLRDGRRVLLGSALFVAPLVQYGLGLFGAAVLFTAALRPGPAPPAKRKADEGRARGWFRRRRGLRSPAGCLAAGGVLTVLTTFRHQFEPGDTVVMGHLLGDYYAGGLGDPGAALSFVAARVGDLLGSFLSVPVAAVLLGGLGLLALTAAWERGRTRFRGPRAGLRRGGAGEAGGDDAGGDEAGPAPGSPSASRVVFTLLAASLALAVAAALARLYPLGAVRQLTYLGPIVFTAAGVLWGIVVRRVSAPLPRRARPFLLAGAAAGLLLAGAQAVARADLRGRTGSMEPILTALAGAGPDDLVYVSGAATPPLRFYADRQGGAYHWAEEGCFRDFGPCLDELTERMGRSSGPPPAEVWILHVNDEQVRAAWSERGEGIPLREAARGFDNTALFLVPDAAGLAQRARRQRRSALLASLGSDGVVGEPLIRDRFRVRRADAGLVYTREPCVPADIEGRFFLRVHPAPVPGERPAAEWGDFDFDDRGVLVDGKCLAVAPLDTGGVARIRTGQDASGEAPGWEATARLDGDRYRDAREVIASGALGEPAARSTFDLYLRRTELLYHRRPCAAEEVEARFFLHLHSPGDPARGGRWGFENGDFDFEEYGMRRDGECLAIVPLPAEGIAAVRTGQWVGDEPPSWRAALRVDRERYRARMDEIASGALGEPAARSVFDLYLGETEMAYHRAPCAPSEVEAPFFLHLTPRARVAGEGRDGFGTRRFDFAERGVRIGSECLALFPLDPGTLSGIVTGQQAEGAALWRVGLPLGPGGLPSDSPVGGAGPAAGLRAEAGPGEPAARSVFDLFFDGTTVTYFKEPCAEEDLRARFFLHFAPSGPADLPGSGGSGNSGTGNSGTGNSGSGNSETVRFENRDFAFPEYGLLLDGQCLARVPAPDTRIDRLVTGQFVSGEGRLWEVTLDLRE